MRRLGVIVALGALLCVLGGVATASPAGVATAWRTSFHLQWCSVLSHRITRHRAKLARLLRVCLHTACLK
jgi:hypothetical protein